jgi:glycine/D-amino acid oxidase-like deaminating enzyme
MTMFAPARELSRLRSETCSYWQARHGLYPAAPAPLPAAADVVVVGGGVVGVATAYWLARRGLRPLLLEADTVASGASGRNAGLVLAGRSPLENPRLLLDVLREEDIDADFEEHGHLALASSPKTLSAFEAEVATRPADAPPLKTLDRRACEELIGLELDDRFVGGRWLPDAASIDPIAFVYGLADAAVRHGAAIACGYEALRVDCPTSGGAVVVTPVGRVRADAIVVACGAASARMLPSLPGLITRRRAQMLATAPTERVFTIALAVDWGTTYWRQTYDGTILLGGSGIEAFLSGAFPTLEVPAIARRWSGTMDATPDDRPIVGSVPGNGDVWIAAGFGGHGLPPALGVGRTLADAIIRGQPAADLAHLDPARFLAEEGSR